MKKKSKSVKDCDFTHVKIRWETKERLKVYKQNYGSYDKAINELIADYERVLK